MNILTWITGTSSGAFQKLVGQEIFSDVVASKPIFSFEFTDIQYIEQNNTYLVDGVDMTVEQKAEVLNRINVIPVPLEWYKAVKKREINGLHDKFVSDYIGEIPASEYATWSKQEEQATAWNADNMISTPMLDGLMTGRADPLETKQMFVDKILSNVSAYQTSYAVVLGNYHNKIKKVAAATTVAEVEAINW